MSYSVTASTATRPRSTAAKALGIVAAALGLVGLVLLVVGAVGAASTTTPNLQGFNPGQPVRVGDSGMSVYARSDAVREQAVCVGRAGEREVVFERPVSSYAVAVSGSDFYEVARSPQDIEPASYALTCEGIDEAVYAGPWAPDTSSGGIAGTTGIVIGAVLLALALLLALAAAVLGRRARGNHPPTQEYLPVYPSPYTVPASGEYTVPASGDPTTPIPQPPYDRGGWAWPGPFAGASEEEQEPHPTEDRPGQPPEDERDTPSGQGNGPGGWPQPPGHH